MRRYFLVVFTAAFLAACGGGGSSSGGGGGTPAGNLAGLYQGTVTLTIAGGGQRATNTFNVSARIAPNGTITDPNTPGFSTQLAGNRFAVTLPPSILAPPGVSCSGTYTILGVISNGTMSVSYSSTNLVCNGIPGNLTGFGTLTQVTFGRAPIDDAPMMDSLGGAVRTLMKQK